VWPEGDDLTKAIMTSQSAETDHALVGLRDALDSGGLDYATGELRPGFRVTADDVVLDVGCGEGNESLFCARQGAHVIYVDIDPTQVEIAGRHLAGAGARALTPLVSDTNPLPLPDGIASKVIASEVIEHVDDPAQFIAELVRAGRPGAQYLFAVPDESSEELQRGLAPPGHFEKPNHIRVISREAFARMVTDAGLVIEGRGTYGFYWSIWWMFFWICHVDLSAPHHPLLESWARTWSLLLDMPNTKEIRHVLNDLLPKSQYIIARKPGDPAVSAHVQREAAGRPVINPAVGLLARLRRFISRSGRAAAAETAPYVPPPVADPIDSVIVGLHDAVESGWFRNDRQELFDGFPILPEDVVLDVGCGRGDHSVVCGNWGAHVVFGDIDPENVAVTERRVRETAAREVTPIVGDANPLLLGDATVTKVVCTEVIEHVDDVARFLGELARVGAPGALYLLAVPDPVQEQLQRRLAPSSFFVKPKPGKGLIRGLSSGHLRTVGREEFEKLVEQAGLVVKSHHYVSFYWAMWFTFFWACNVDFSTPNHPLLASWARTWKYVLDAPDGVRVKKPFDAFMPKSQIIVAYKP
jgi:2-polyprenyl-3-methyl-5-hydroxy-6-metoxy-1,4-benzoquinol methylase